MIEFNCPSCDQDYRVKDEMAGKKARCKNCDTAMVVPAASESGSVQGETFRVPSTAATPAAPPPQQASSPASNKGSSWEPTSREDRRQNVRGSSEHFAFEISQRPDFALVTVNLSQGQKIYAETSAMASMSPTIKLQAGLKGGLAKSIGRAFGGDSMIINTFTAEEGEGEVTFAAGAAGDAAHYRLTGNTLYLQRGAFMLHSEGVEVTGKWQGAKGFFSGEGLVLLKASGNGDVFFNSYGAILSVDVKDEYIVDTGYIVAFEDTLDYRISVLPGLRGGSRLKQFFFGGEGLVCRFAGQGKVWIQTRHVQSFLSWVNPYRPTKNN